MALRQKNFLGSALLYPALFLSVLIVSAVGAPGGSQPSENIAGADALDKLVNIEVPLMVFVVDALEEEGLAFNALNRNLTEPVFDSVRWDLARRHLVWRFWVAPDGVLADSIRNSERAQALSLLSEKMTNLAIVTGVEPHPEFNQRVGALGVFRIPVFFTLTEEDISNARNELAAASIIQVAAAHPAGPIMLSRMPDGMIHEEIIALNSQSQQQSAKRRK